MKNRTNYLIKNTLIFAIGNIGSKLVSFLLVPLYTALLLPTEYGTIDIITTLSILISPLLMLNIHESVLRFLLEKKVTKEKVLSVCNLMLILNIILSIITFFVFNSISEYHDYAIYISLLFFSVALQPLTLSYARGTEKVKTYAFLSIFHTLVTALATILFLAVFKMKIDGYLLGLIIGNISVYLIGLFITDMHKYIFKFEIDKTYISMLLKYCVFLIPNSIFWWIINSSDRLMIKYMMDNTAVGYFAVAYKIPSILAIFTTIFTQAWQLTAITDDSSKEESNQYANNLFNIVYTTLFIISSFIMLLIRLVMKIYVAEDYYISWQYVPLLLLCFIFLSLSNFVSVSFAKAKDTKNIMISSLIGASLNILLNYLLIPKYGINGASFAACISYLSILVYKVLVGRKYIDYKLFTVKKGIYLALFIGQLICIYLQNEILSYILLSIFLIVTIILSIPEIKTMFKQFKDIINNKIKRKNNE